jgi:hypothetical protein
MNASDFKAHLEALENGKDLYEFYVSSVETEKQRGISEVRERNKEAESLRKFKIAFEKLGFNKESDELDSYVETLKTSKSKASEADSTKLTLGEVNSELAALRDKFLAAQNELNTERKRASESALEAKKKALKLKLNTALNDKVYGPDFVADTLINDGKVDLEGDTVFFKEGDAKVAFEDGIKKLLEVRTDILKNTQKGGAQSAPQQGSTNKKFSMEQIESMSKEDIKANLKDIKSSLGITV